MGVGELLADALEEHAHAQRNDEGLRALMHDEEAVDDAHESAAGDGGEEAHPDGQPQVDQSNGDDAAQAERATHGKVAAAADDGDGDAKGDDLQNRHGAQHLQPVVGGVEIGVEKEHAEEHHQDGEHGLLLGQRLPELLQSARGAGLCQ